VDSLPRTWLPSISTQSQCWEHRFKSSCVVLHPWSSLPVCPI
jgi:hypothetical protein